MVAQIDLLLIIIGCYSVFRVILNYILVISETIVKKPTLHFFLNRVPNVLYEFNTFVILFSMLRIYC